MTQKNALLSVYHKTDKFFAGARTLFNFGWRLYASGGTAKELEAAGIAVVDIQTIVGEKVMDGRVSTLSREIHGGLLSRATIEADLRALEGMGAPYIDLVYVDPYPLAEEIANPKATEESVTAKTDIGGPAMIRSGAKGRRIVVTNDAQFESVVAKLRSGEEITEEFLRQLAAYGEFTVAQYGMVSAEFLSSGELVASFGERVAVCDYGENRYQTPAYLFRNPNNTYPLAVTNFRLVDGRQPSYINYTDMNRVIRTITRMAAGHDYNFGTVPLMAVAVKHGNACGAAFGSDPVSVLQKTVMGDPQSVFGSILMTNFPIDEELAKVLRYYGVPKGDPPRIFDGICAPDIEPIAQAIAARRDGKYVMTVNPALANLSMETLDRRMVRRELVGGDFLMQPANTFVLPLDRLEVIGELLTEQQQLDVVMASAICATSNSNTITLVNEGQLVGNSAGQQSRVTACIYAVDKAKAHGHDLRNGVASSDSFFVKPDAPMVLADTGLGLIQATYTSTPEKVSKADTEVKVVCRSRGTTLAWMPDAEARVFDQH